MTAIEPGVDESPDTTMEVQVEGTEAIPTQIGDPDEDDPLIQALEEAEEGP